MTFNEYNEKVLEVDELTKYNCKYSNYYFGDTRIFSVKIDKEEYKLLFHKFSTMVELASSIDSFRNLIVNRLKQSISAVLRVMDNISNRKFIDIFPRYVTDYDGAAEISDLYNEHSFIESNNEHISIYGLDQEIYSAILWLLYYRVFIEKKDGIELLESLQEPQLVVQRLGIDIESSLIYKDNLVIVNDGNNEDILNNNRKTAEIVKRLSMQRFRALNIDVNKVSETNRTFYCRLNIPEYVTDSTLIDFYNKAFDLIVFNNEAKSKLVDNNERANRFRDILQEYSDKLHIDREKNKEEILLLYILYSNAIKNSKIKLTIEKLEPKKLNRALNKLRALGANITIRYWTIGKVIYDINLGDRCIAFTSGNVKYLDNVKG